VHAKRSRLVAAGAAVALACAFGAHGARVGQPRLHANGKIVFSGDGVDFVRLPGRPLAPPPPPPPPPPPHRAIFTMNPDGTGITQLTGVGANFDPSWSPDGSRIAFVGAAPPYPYNSDIYTMKADGSELVNLTNSPAGDGDPDWSPDGKKIVFVSSGGQGGLWVMNADGANAYQLTSSNDGQPAWSPDGASIAFASVRDGAGYQIYRYSFNGDLRQLTTNETGSSGPAWSPDGSKIVFTGDAGLYLMNADGSNQRRLTTSPTGFDFEPAWSPDGRKIVFTRGSDLWEIAADGSGERNVTNTPSRFDGSADWQPLAPLPRCLVPKVTGLRLASARVRIRRARCTVGRVRRAKSRRVGRVLAQNPRAGAQRLVGGRVNLLVGRR
jgi:Tol biopolymer transport system component